MTKTKIMGKVLAAVIATMSIAACYAQVSGPTVECRNTVRRRGDVETCRTRCGDEGCRTRCADQERYSREHHCWVE